jgi:amino acid transporter
MDRFSNLLTPMTGAVLTGTIVIAAFSMGYYGWPTIITAALVGFLLSWPVAYAISRLAKRNDRNWDHTRVDRTDRVPRPGDPEV